MHASCRWVIILNHVYEGLGTWGGSITQGGCVLKNIKFQNSLSNPPEEIFQFKFLNTKNNFYKKKNLNVAFFQPLL